MPTRVLHEGPALEPLLAQVREQYGSSVRIISADKVRTGGLAGFFTKQRYELSVEVPDEPATPAAASRPATEEPVDSLDKLLARAEARDRFAGSTGARSADERAAERREVVLPPRAAMISTNGNAFAEVMAGLGRPAAEAGASPLAEKVAAPLTERIAAVSVPTRADAPTVRPFRPATVAATPVNSASAADVEPISAAPVSATPVNSVSAIPANVSTPAELLAALTQPMNGYDTPNTGYAPFRPATAPPTTPATAASAEAPIPLVAELMKLGMPASMAADVTGTDAYSAVLSALADLPEAPSVPDRPGDVLVIAGDLAHALPVARRIVDQLRLDGSHLLLAGPSTTGTGIHPSRRISGPAEAERRARRMHRADAPYVVVMDAPATDLNGTWVRETCDALGATAVWAVVDATRKSADSRRHVETISDVEAVVVHGTGATADPASVLGLDLPVVELDGRPATPHAWAALLCERLTVATQGAKPNRRRIRGR